MKISLFLQAGLLLPLGLFLCQPAGAAATLTVTPSTFTNGFTGKIVLNATGLTPGQTVRVEKYADANGNGTIDPGELLIQSFLITDGKLPLIGGVRNPNVPGDEDGTADGQIRAELADVSSDTEAGNFIYRVADSTGHFTIGTGKIAVAQKVRPQGVRGTVMVAGVPQPYTLVVLLSAGAGASFVFADSVGRYVIYANPGDYLVAALTPGFVSDGRVGGLRINANQFATNNPVLTVANIAVTGKLGDNITVAGIPGVAIIAQSTNNSIVLGFTDSGGSYILHTTPGTWKLFPSQSSLAQVGYLSSEQGVQINLTNASVIDFAVPKATALIYGTLQAGGTPLNGIDFFGIEPSGQYKAQGHSFFPNGNYALGVVAGTWSVRPSLDDPNVAGFNIQGRTVIVGDGQAQLVDFAADSIAPSLVSSSPPNNAVDVPLNSVLVFLFSEPMGPSYSINWSGNISANNFTYSWSADQKTLSCAYSGSLPSGARIEWTLNPSNYNPKFRDIAGNQLPSDITGNSTTVALTTETLRLRISQSSKGFRLEWSSLSGRTYQLQSSTGLSAWNDTGVPLSGTGATLSFESALPSQGALFFRVRAN